MTAIATIKDNKTTISFSYTADTTKVSAVLNSCAEYLWKEVEEEGVVTNPFSEATNAEKLAVVDKHIKSVLIDMGNSFISNKLQAEARESVEKLDL